MENRILGKSVAILHRREQKYMTKTMKEYGIGYSSYNFLFYLSANPGSSQKEMCENMAVDEALAVRTMKKLQEQGFVEKRNQKHTEGLMPFISRRREKRLYQKMRKALTVWWSQVLSVLWKKSSSSWSSDWKKWLPIQKKYFIILKHSRRKSMEEKQNNPLGSEPIGTLIARFAIPSIIAMLVSSLYNIVDQFFIGRSVGMLGNAATNVAFPLSITCTAISLLCGIGGAANFNLAMGRKEKEKAVTFAGGSIGMMLILGVLLCVISQIFLEPMMRAFGATEKVLDYSLEYTGITALGFPFLIVTTGGSNLIRADGSPKFSMMCTLVGAIINTILDPLFIFIFDMGSQVQPGQQSSDK